MSRVGESRQRCIQLRARNKPENKQEMQNNDFAIIPWHRIMCLHNTVWRNQFLVCAEARM